MKSFLNFLVLFALMCILSYTQNESTVKAKYDISSFDKQVTLPGTPEVIFDAVTGDISGWWDHSFTDNPKEFYDSAILKNFSYSIPLYRTKIFFGGN